MRQTARRRLACAVLVGALLAPATAFASQVIDSQSGAGDYAIVIASGSVHHPKRISVRVSSHPAQRVTGSWTMVCSKGLSAGSKSGHISGVGAFSRTLKMPRRHPDDCSVSASAQLDRGGKVHVTLVSR